MFQLTINSDSFFSNAALYEDIECTKILPQVLPFVQGFRGTIRVYIVGSNAPKEGEMGMLAIRPLRYREDLFRTKYAERQIDEAGNVYYDLSLNADTAELQGALFGKETLPVRAGIISILDTGADADKTRVEWQFSASISSSALAGLKPIEPTPSAIDEHNEDPEAHQPIQTALRSEILAAGGAIQSEFQTEVCAALMRLRNCFSSCKARFGSVCSPTVNASVVYTTNMTSNIISGSTVSGSTVSGRRFLLSTSSTTSEYLCESWKAYTDSKASDASVCLSAHKETVASTSLGHVKVCGCKGLTPTDSAVVGFGNCNQLMVPQAEERAFGAVRLGTVMTLTIGDSGIVGKTAGGQLMAMKASQNARNYGTVKIAGNNRKLWSPNSTEVIPVSAAIVQFEAFCNDVGNLCGIVGAMSTKIKTGHVCASWIETTEIVATDIYLENAIAPSLTEVAIIASEVRNSEVAIRVGRKSWKHQTTVVCTPVGIIRTPLYTTELFETEYGGVSVSGSGGVSVSSGGGVSIRIHPCGEEQGVSINTRSCTPTRIGNPLAYTQICSNLCTTGANVVRFRNTLGVIVGPGSGNVFLSPSSCSSFNKKTKFVCGIQIGDRDVVLDAEGLSIGNGAGFLMDGSGLLETAAGVRVNIMGELYASGVVYICNCSRAKCNYTQPCAITRNSQIGNKTICYTTADGYTAATKSDNTLYIVS